MKYSFSVSEVYLFKKTLSQTLVHLNYLFIFTKWLENFTLHVMKLSPSNPIPQPKTGNRKPTHIKIKLQPKDPLRIRRSLLVVLHSILGEGALYFIDLRRPCPKVSCEL